MMMFRVAYSAPEQYINPDDNGPIKGRREGACSCEAKVGSSRYAERKTPNAFGNPQTRVSTKKAPAN